MRYAGKVEAISLSQPEFRLALELFRRMGQTVAQIELLDILRLPIDPLGMRTLEDRISRLRRKLDLKDKPETRLRRIYGVGFQLDVDLDVRIDSMLATKMASDDAAH